MSTGTDKVPVLSYCRLQVAICNHYPDESGLRVRIRFTSSKLLKSSRMKLTAKRNAVPLGAKFQALFRESLVEPTGIEPVTSCLQSRRSPS